MEIRYPRNAAEYQTALRLVEVEYRSRRYVDRLEPLNGPDAHVLVAVENGVIIGTVSIVLASAPPPTSIYFGFDVSLRYPEYTPVQIMEIGRLALCTDEDRQIRKVALCGLFAAMQRWGDVRGVKLAIASLRPDLRRLLSAMGIPSEQVAGPERLVRQMIPPEYWGYFFPSETARRPVAVHIDFDAARQPIFALGPVASGKVTFSLEITSPSLALGSYGAPPHPIPAA